MIPIILIFVIVVDTMLMIKSVSPLQESTNSIDIGDDNLPVLVFIPMSHYVYSLTIMLSNTDNELTVSIYVQ